MSKFRRVKERRPLDDNPNGYKESDTDYVMNNLSTAVKLLDWLAKQGGNLDCIPGNLTKV